MLGIQQMTVCSDIYVMKVSGLFLRTYTFLHSLVYRQIVKC